VSLECTLCFVFAASREDEPVIAAALKALGNVWPLQ
jgi:hypothetical protein